MCPRCGAQNPEGSLFCQNCGAPLAGGQAGPPPRHDVLPPPGIIQPPGAPPPPPAGSPIPVGGVPAGGFPPPGYSPYQSPYYVPVGPPGAPVHRLPWFSIIGLALGVLGIVALGATLLLRSNVPTVRSLSPLPTATAVPTTRPQETSTAVPTNTSVPTSIPTGTAMPTSGATVTAAPTSVPAETDTPASSSSPAATDTLAATVEAPTATAVVTDTPAVPEATATTAKLQKPATSKTPTGLHIPAPTPVPTKAAHTATTACRITAGKVVATNTFCVALLQGWSVLQKENVDIILKDDTGGGGFGTLYINSGTLKTPTTAQEWLQQVIAGYQKQYPDVKECGTAAQFTVGSVTGTGIPICYSETPQGGAAFPAVSELWAATNGGGTTVYSFGMNAAASDAKMLDNTSKLLESLQWYLP